MIASTTAGTTAAIVTTMQASSYRVKFKKQEFLELLETAHAPNIYHRGKSYFFAFDGFLMYCQECNDDDFRNHKVIEVIELSNGMWST
jgi:hypothetical protein